VDRRDDVESFYQCHQMITSNHVHRQKHVVYSDQTIHSLPHWCSVEKSEILYRTAGRIHGVTSVLTLSAFGPRHRVNSIDRPHAHYGTQLISEVPSLFIHYSLMLVQNVSATKFCAGSLRPLIPSVRCRNYPISRSTMAPTGSVTLIPIPLAAALVAYSSSQQLSYTVQS